MVAHNLTKVVDKRLHYVQIVSGCSFTGNFVLAKVSPGLISVRCMELRGVCFSEVRNVFYGKINWGQVTCPLYRGSPLFGGSVIRGYTVLAMYCTSLIRYI